MGGRNGQRFGRFPIIYETNSEISFLEVKHHEKQVTQTIDESGGCCRHIRTSYGRTDDILCQHGSGK